MSASSGPLKVPLYGGVCEVCGYPLTGMVVFPNGKILVHQDRRVLDHRLGVIPDPPTKTQQAPAPVLARTA